jgi:hypothetical protein
LQLRGGRWHRMPSATPDFAMRLSIILRSAALVCATLLSLSAPARAFDANGVSLGGREAEVKKAFPSARCKPLEWRSEAADRRCDDAEISLGGIPARITFYLKRDAVQGFDLRFDTRDLERMSAFLKKRVTPSNARVMLPGRYTERVGKKAAIMLCSRRSSRESARHCLSRAVSSTKRSTA